MSENEVNEVHAFDVYVLTTTRFKVGIPKGRTKEDARKYLRKRGVEMDGKLAFRMDDGDRLGGFDPTDIDIQDVDWIDVVDEDADQHLPALVRWTAVVLFVARAQRGWQETSVLLDIGANESMVRSALLTKFNAKPTTTDVRLVNIECAVPDAS